MKRLSVILLLPLVCIFSYAHTVQTQQACDVAKMFFGLSTRSDDLKLAFSSSELYGFNRNGGGFVIISGDNTLRPVFGYSDSGSIPSYEDMPDNMKWWLDVLSRSVIQKRKMNVLPDMALLKEWENPRCIMTKSGTVLKYLATPEWDQSAPFNNKCPVDAGGRAYAGCLPIALCEIMTYYQWPPKVDADGYGTVYNWDELSKVTGKNASGKSDAVKENLAQLVYDVGRTAGVVYSSEGTAGLTLYVVSRISGPFRYRKDAKYEKREFYDEPVWQKMITDEIDKGRPVFYSGIDIDAAKRQGGHAFVMDGYDSDGLVHINFGWSNGSSGYFWLGEKYFGNQEAIFDFVPDKEGSSVTPDGGLYLSNFKFNSGYYTFNPLTEIKKNQTIKFEVCNFNNDNKGIYYGSVKLVHENKSGVKVEDASNSYNKSGLPVGAVWIPQIFSGTLYFDIGFGDRIVVYEGSATLGKWNPIKVSKQGETVPYFPLTPYAFIETKGSYVVGERFYLKLFNNDFPYVFGGDNGELYTQWKFFLDGELKADITDYSARWYNLPQAGTWTVQATVKYIKDDSVKTVLSAQIEVSK